MVTCCVSFLFIHQKDGFSVADLVWHSNIFCWAFIKNVQLSDSTVIMKYLEIVLTHPQQNNM